jgi:predicted alpha/beta-fold hydrolase
MALRRQPAETAFIKVSQDTSLLAYCHLSGSDRLKPTFILVHGLEGSSQSSYILGLAESAVKAGANVIRLNLRNCGESLHLTPTLYNAGLSGDLLTVIDWLVESKHLTNLFLVGFSLGGNLVLKTAAELEHRLSAVSAVCAVSPSIDLDACVRSLEKGLCRAYELNFLFSLKNKLIRKYKLFPDRYDLSQLAKVTRLRQFDDLYTAPDGGYANAAEYYLKASSLPLMNKIASPTLIITAQDDPIVPFELFSLIETDFVRLLAPKHGGHGAFILRGDGIFGMAGPAERYWVDAQILRFCFANSKNLNERAG